MKNKPIEIKSFPGQAVDRHLKLYGHLPELGCCEHDQPTQKPWWAEPLAKIVFETDTSEKESILLEKELGSLIALVEAKTLERAAAEVMKYKENNPFTPCGRCRGGWQSICTCKVIRPVCSDIAKAIESLGNK